MCYSGNIRAAASCSLYKLEKVARTTESACKNSVFLWLSISTLVSIIFNLVHEHFHFQIYIYIYMLLKKRIIKKE